MTYITFKYEINYMKIITIRVECNDIVFHIFFKIKVLEKNKTAYL